MRYSDRVTLIGEPLEEYDTTLGEVIEVDGFRKTLPCNMSDVGVQGVSQLFGDVTKRVTVVRLQSKWRGDEVAFVEIDGKRYNVLKRSDGRRETSFYIEGVRSWQ